uniref:Glyco_hydro_38N domain-containing protein n=1 Tax=Meloidogyne hapla TaxID=6305 RepID=A0A1I8B262_MELHA
MSFTIFLFILLLFSNVKSEKCAFDNCPKWSNSPNIINVHLVPHSYTFLNLSKNKNNIFNRHDDMGWIKTVDDYYTGAHPRLVPVGVQYILNTVIDELLKNASRRFCYAEAGFLHRWLLDHNNEQKEKLRHLIVESGQMEIIGGGWTQPDEATTHYIDIIDQYSTGLALLNSTYGNCGRPRIAWQIDPFGHSREHSNIVKMLGHKALFFARTHYKELEYRADNKELEFKWKVTSDEGEINVNFIKLI